MKDKQFSNGISQWRILAGMAFGLLVVVVGTLLASSKALEIRWHRYRSGELWKQIENPPPGRDVTEEALQFEKHLNRLVALGSVVKREYRCQHLRNSTETYRVVWKRIHFRDCPHWLYAVGSYDKEPTPAVIQIWCEPGDVSKWDEFFESVDKPQ